VKKTKLVKKVVKDEPVILPEVHNDRSYIGYTSGENFSFGEEREFKANPVASKYAFDLYKEEDAVVTPLIRVRHVRSPNKTDKWKVFENNKNVFTLDGTKISKKEREFLHSVEGAQFLLSQSKSGPLTLNGLKKEMKARLIQLSAKGKNTIR
jgi:hypothetical protein